YKVEQIPEQDINDVAVSSTRIREALIKGDMDTANLYLGYPFHLTGRVVRGNQLGREIGFPTANLQVYESHKLIPAYGIYAIRARLIEHPTIETGAHQPTTIAQNFVGMGYIGNRPTIEGIGRSIEVNLFDFQGDLYDQTLQVDFLHFIRPDQRFDSLEEMIEQMNEDRQATLRLLAIAGAK